MKRCTTCGVEKLTSEFHKSRTGLYGVASVCRVCVASKHKDYYAKNREKIIAATAAYHRSNIEKNRKWQSKYSEKHLSKILESKRAANRRKPEIKRAHRMVAAAIKSGRLIRMPCEVCASVKSQAHHDDYSKPLDVKWLCSLHHNQLHANGRISNGSSSTTQTAAAGTTASERPEPEPSYF